MADKTIGELTPISTVTDGTMIPVQQGNAAGRMSGEQFRTWAVNSVASQRSQAELAAAGAALSKTAAEEAAEAAAESAGEIEDLLDTLSVAATTLAAGSEATVEKVVLGDGSIRLNFGIPQGAKGNTGAQGTQGVQGERGGVGTAVVVEVAGTISFRVDLDEESETYGHLLLTYAEDAFDPEDCPYHIDDDPQSPTYGHLLWEVD